MEASNCRRVAGEGLGALDGLPVAIKDLVDTAGVRTTDGSPRFRDHVPERDDLVASRLRAAGAVLVGKSNTPEWARSHTCSTRSSGSCGTPGTDPARRRLERRGRRGAGLLHGRYRRRQRSGGWIAPCATLQSVERRGVGAAADARPRGPSRPSPAPLAALSRRRRWRAPPLTSRSCSARLQAPIRVRRCRWARRVRVHAPPRRRPARPARRVLGDARRPAGRAGDRLRARARPPWLSDAGLQVEADEPDLRGADEVFETWRAFAYALSLGEFHDAEPGSLKASVRGEVERGRALSASDLSARDAPACGADRARGRRSSPATTTSSARPPSPSRSPSSWSTRRGSRGWRPAPTSSGCARARA